MVVWFGFRAVRGCWSGLWRFLTARTHWRSTVALEREWNAGTAQAIVLLPPGAELMEREPTGRLRIIRIPPPPPGTSSQTRRQQFEHLESWPDE